MHPKRLAKPGKRRLQSVALMSCPSVWSVPYTSLRRQKAAAFSAKDPSDTGQITLIRKHLSMISKEFAQGNFSAPASIHGSNMPGLAELEKARPDQLRIEYQELPDGAQIEYSSDAPGLVEAIHRWFDAQLADHAGYALPGMPSTP